MDSSMGGYDFHFVEDPPDALKCLICLLVVRDPQQHGECGKLFCKSCITEYRQQVDDCPYCRQTLTTFSDGKSTQDVKSLKVRCDNGCRWIGELRSHEEHIIRGCYNSRVPCPNNCQQGPQLILQKNLDHHIMHKCSKRQYKCPYCKEYGVYDEITSSHLKVCPDAEVSCPLALCKAKIARSRLSEHMSNCGYEFVACKYAEVGCNYKPLRKDLKTHEEDGGLHFKIFFEIVKKQSKKIVLLEEKLFNLSFNFKLLDYQDKKTTREIFISSPFYTHPNGYKMYIIINASGNGEGEGTHVSVFSYIMQGENDDSLAWPFTGTVMFELLNQLQDDNHHKMTIPFLADNMASKRVVDGVRGGGFGYPKFIAHNDIYHKTDTNCQYLRNDSLIFRVSVKVPDYKQWLDCHEAK